MAGRRQGSLGHSFSGMVTNSVLFCLLFTITDHCKKVFLQTNNQGLRQLKLLACWAQGGLPDIFLVSLQFPKLCTSRDLGPLKDTETAQKVLQGSETHALLKGMEENNTLTNEGLLICLLYEFYKNSKGNKFELVTKTAFFRRTTTPSPSVSSTTEDAVGVSSTVPPIGKMNEEDNFSLSKSNEKYLCPG